MLVLPIKKKWFDMILSGEKKEEYRELTWYWRVRFTNAGLLDRYGFGWLPQRVMFRNGYSKTSPSFVALVSAEAKEGRSEWGAEPEKIYWVLKILEIENDIEKKGK